MAEELYAFIKGIDIVNTAVFDNPTEELLNEFKEFHQVDHIIPCHGYVGPGWTWQFENFIIPQPYPSWTLNLEEKRWEAPIPEPKEEGKRYRWNEDAQSWDIITMEENPEA